MGFVARGGSFANRGPLWSQVGAFRGRLFGNRFGRARRGGSGEGWSGGPCGRPPWPFAAVGGSVSEVPLQARAATRAPTTPNRHPRPYAYTWHAPKNLPLRGRWVGGHFV